MPAVVGALAGRWAQEGGGESGTQSRAGSMLLRREPMAERRTSAGRGVWVLEALALLSAGGCVRLAEWNRGGVGTGGVQAAGGMTGGLSGSGGRVSSGGTGSTVGDDFPAVVSPGGGCSPVEVPSMSPGFAGATGAASAVQTDACRAFDDFHFDPPCGADDIVVPRSCYLNRLYLSFQVQLHHVPIKEDLWVGLIPAGAGMGGASATASLKPLTTSWDLPFFQVGEDGSVSVSFELPGQIWWGSSFTSFESCEGERMFLGYVAILERSAVLAERRLIVPETYSCIVK